MESLADYAEQFGEYSDLLDKALHYLGDKAKEAAEAERIYRKAKSVAWIEVLQELPKGTVPEREAWVDGQVADLRFDRDLAEGLRQTGLEAVRSRRTQISALQSLLAAYKVEAEFARTGGGL